MNGKASPNDKGTASPKNEPLYEAFPEPRAWAQQWDGNALYAIMNHKKPKQ